MGNTWSKVPSNKLPKVMDGEAALRQATNILIKGNNTWLVSGGKNREFYSPDKEIHGQF
jgi:hypothetical protein